METTWWTQPDQLDSTQQEVVALKENESHLIIGPPGSGKTNLLILRAAHLYLAGIKNIAVLTFGRILREFLSAGTGNYEFPSDRIQTYVKWGTNLLKMNDEKFDDSANFEELRPKLLARLKRWPRSSRR